MRKFKSKLKVFLTLLLLFLCSISLVTESKNNYPDPTNLKYINDYVNIIDTNYKQKIVSIGKELEDKTTAQAVVVVVDTLNNIPIEDYANKLFRTWGIGEGSKDNGLLILVAINDRQFRVEVGRGLEGVIPDALSNRVMESIAKPLFAEGNYGEGILNSYSIFSDYIAGEYGVTLDKSLNVTLPSNNKHSNNKGIGFLGFGFLALIFLDVFLNRGRVISTLLQLIFFNNFFNGGRRGGGGFGGGNSGGGGFGGFGGGSSNGGGSSGSW